MDRAQRQRAHERMTMPGKRFQPDHHPTACLLSGSRAAAYCASATQATQAGCQAINREGERKGKVGQHSPGRRVSLALCPRQATMRRRRADGTKVFVALCVGATGRDSGAAAMRRATEIWRTWSRTLARAGKRRTAGCSCAEGRCQDSRQPSPSQPVRNVSERNPPRCSLEKGCVL